jgi:hypothetical protein
MQYFVVMIDYRRRRREAVVDPEITRDGPKLNQMA